MLCYHLPSTSHSTSLVVSNSLCCHYNPFQNSSLFTIFCCTWLSSHTLVFPSPTSSTELAMVVFPVFRWWCAPHFNSPNWPVQQSSSWQYFRQWWDTTKLYPRTLQLTDKPQQWWEMTKLSPNLYWLWQTVELSNALWLHNWPLSWPSNSSPLFNFPLLTLCATEWWNNTRDFSSY